MTNEELVSVYQKTGKAEDLEEICKRNHGLVFMIVRDFRSVYDGESASRAVVVESDDLMQAGYIGLMQAVKQYDPERGAAFSTVAGLHIRAVILRELSSTGHNIRIPEHKRKDLKRLKECRHYLTAQCGREPARDEIAAFMGIDGHEVDELFKIEMRANIASLNAPLSDESGADTLGDTIPGAVDPIEQLENEMINEELRRELWGLVDSLEPEQAAILHSFYEDGETLSEIGERMRLTGRRVAQIKSNALQALRKGQCRRVLRELTEDYERAESAAYKAGAGAFLRTRTSATERAAIMRIEATEKAVNRVKEQGNLNGAGLSRSERKQYFEMLCRERQQKNKAQIRALKEEL